MPEKLWTEFVMLSGAFLIVQLVKNLPVMQVTLITFLGQNIPWRKDRLPTPVFLGFPYGSAGKESSCSVGDLGSIPGLGKSLGEEKGYPLQYSGLENSRVSTVHGVTKLDTTETLSLFITLYGRWLSKPSPRKRNAKKSKWLYEEGLEIPEKRREAKGKGDKERYIHLNAEFQGMARRDKKAFLKDQRKEHLGAHNVKHMIIYKNYISWFISFVFIYLK